MITIYEVGPNNYWTGATAEIAEDGGAPRGWTRAVPPSLGANQFAVWNLGWSVTATPVAPPPEPVPEEISDRQFFQALWEEGHISYEEAVAAVETGTIPATMEGFIALLESYDEIGAKKARLLLKGATEFKRSNYIVPVFGSMYGMGENQIDELWRMAAVL